MEANDVKKETVKKKKNVCENKWNKSKKLNESNRK